MEVQIKVECSSTAHICTNKSKVFCFVPKVWYWNMGVWGLDLFQKHPVDRNASLIEEHDTGTSLVLLFKKPKPKINSKRFTT